MTTPSGPDRSGIDPAPSSTNRDDERAQLDGAYDTLAFRECQPRGRWIERSTASLRPHPQYYELWGEIASTRLLRVSEQSGPIVEPLLTTIDGTILDGHARWQLARQREQPSVPCLVYEVSEEEALEIVIQRHRATGGLNAYARIVLALHLEPHFRKETASPQETIVGRGTQSSNLTKHASRDVRQDIARIAGVSTGNVTKVKQVLDGVIPEIREALLRGDVSIHRAWKWRTFNVKARRDALWAHLHRRDIKTTVRRLVRSHASSSCAQPIDNAPAILGALAICDPADLAVSVVDVPGHAVVVTRALYEDLRRRSDATR